MRSMTIATSPDRRALALFLSLTLLTSGVLLADARTTHGGTYAQTDDLDPIKAKKMDDMRSAIKIPTDLSSIQTTFFECFLTALKLDPQSNNLVNVKRVKASWETHAYGLDSTSGALQTLAVDKGTLKTGSSGDIVSIPIPTAVINAVSTQAFKSGDLSVFLVTYARFKKGKKISIGGFDCLLSERSR